MTLQGLWRFYRGNPNPIPNQGLWRFYRGNPNPTPNQGLWRFYVCALRTPPTCDVDAPGAGAGLGYQAPTPLVT